MRVTMKRSSTTAARRLNVIERFTWCSCSQGMGGLNLRILTDCYHSHGQIFFRKPEVLIISNRTKQIKSLVNAGVFWERCRRGGRKSGIYFLLPSRVAIDRPENGREIQGGGVGRMPSQRQ
jgi:hypothetical protein